MALDDGLTPLNGKQAPPHGIATCRKFNRVDQVTFPVPPSADGSPLGKKGPIRKSGLQPRARCADEKAMSAKHSPSTEQIDAPARAAFALKIRAFGERSKHRVEKGATAVEYALMIGLLAIGIIAALTSLKEKTVDSLQHTAASTSGLIFPARVTFGQPFTVKYIRNDLAAGGWVGVGATDWTTTFSSSSVLTNTPGTVDFLANLTAPSTPGVYEVQVRIGSGNTAVLESAPLRVV